MYSDDFDVFVVLFFISNLFGCFLMQDIAKKKGYENTGASFAACFFLGIFGYIYVLALPDKTLQKQLDILIPGLSDVENKNGNTGNSVTNQSKYWESYQPEIHMNNPHMNYVKEPSSNTGEGNSTEMKNEGQERTNTNGFNEQPCRTASSVNQVVTNGDVISSNNSTDSTQVVEASKLTRNQNVAEILRELRKLHESGAISDGKYQEELSKLMKSI